MYICTRTDGSGNPRHNERHSKKRDDGTASRQGDGECHITSCQHGKDVTGTATRTACNEHDAQEKEGRKVENRTYYPSNEGQEDDLSNDSSQNGKRALENETEIVRTQRESEIEHQERQNG